MALLPDLIKLGSSISPLNLRVAIGYSDSSMVRETAQTLQFWRELQGPMLERNKQRFGHLFAVSKNHVYNIRQRQGLCRSVTVPAETI